jgi:hypothetical protein
VSDEPNINVLLSAGSQPGHPSAPRGSSPYSSGGGGVTFERRVAACYLARLLTGATAAELEGRRVSRVTFQQAPARPVDDLVIYAARDGEIGPSLELAVAVRRAPDFVTSDTATVKLVTKFLQALRDAERVSTGVDQLFAICVAGARKASRQVAELAALAKDHQADSFFSVLRTPGKFRKELVSRLRHLVNLVKAGLAALGEAASDEIAERTTWALLWRLYVLMPRVEPPDEADWEELLGMLEPWSRDQSLQAAAALRDRLESLAARYAPNAAVVELPALRREAHDVLSPDRHRNYRGWAELMRLDQDAREDVRTEMGLGPAPARLHLARKAEAEALRKRLENDCYVLICGGSGVGKSALVLSELSAAVEADPLRYQVVFINLRLMPTTISELRSAIGCGIEDVLREMSAPVRLLVVDAAEYLGESSSALLSHVVRAAKSSDVGVWVITSTEGQAAVRSVIETILAPVVEHEIQALSDEDLTEVATAFPQLGSLMANARSKELLRRPVVADLLVRAGSADHPLSDADALRIVWTKLVRADGRTERGTPDSRDQVFRRLARHQLQPGSTNELYVSLDPAALDGLRRDDLVRSPSAAPWQVLPDFSHELLRTYAACHALLADGEPVTALLEAGAPRWALPAARLAAQVLFAAPESSNVPREHRFEKIQADFDRIAAAGHGERWSDLPTEAALPLPQAGEILGGAWTQLLQEDAQGLRRVLRVIQQRHRKDGVVAPLVAEPIVELLLERDWPNSRDLKKGVEELLRGWLGALVMAGTPAGHALRLKLRRSIVQTVQQGDRRLAEEAAKEAAELAARSPEQVREDEKRAKEFAWLSAPFFGGSRQRWVELPKELIHESTVEKLSLLGADLGDEGEELLRRVARDAPHHLAPGLEEVFTDYGLASYRPSLLTELVEAYYFDCRDDDFGMRDLNYGIRDHHSRGPVDPLYAYYKGPFFSMFQADFRNGVACLNRLLNHAAKVRAAVLQDSSWAASEESVVDRECKITLSITGLPRTYVGDSHVWRWYRGTGVGPYPCMSALQALEFVCDQYLEAGILPRDLVTVLLEGCENLAMPALVVGLLVRHLEIAGYALDRFLTEPMIWHLEFGRVIGEHSLLAARSERVRASERRKWSLREAAMSLVLRAEGERIDSLRKLGERLIERACELEEAELKAMPGDGEETSLSENLAAVHGWAAALDRGSYQVSEHEGRLLIQPAVPDDVRQTLEPGNRDLSRGNQGTHLLVRYVYERHNLAGPPKVSLAELKSDLATARELLADPPAASPSGPLAAPAAVAAGALELRFVTGMPVASEDLVWSVQLLVEIAMLCASAEGWDYHYLSQFSQGPDRSAARGIPFVFLPDAADLRAELGGTGISPTDLADAARWLAASSPLEARLLYAKSMNLTWRAPCDDETPAKCHHSLAFQLLEDSARDCVIGSWDFETQRNKLEHLNGPLDQAIAAVADDKIIVPHLSPAIRALGVAANTPSCCTARAKVLLAALLAAHRRGMAARKQKYMHSASDTLVVARALLVGVANGSEDLLQEQVKHYAANPKLLAELLQALAAAAEENVTAAEAARRVWPKLIDQVLDGSDTGNRTSRHDYFERAELAALLPNRAFEFGYLRRELAAQPIDWIDVIAWRGQVERWLPLAAGSPRCVDSFVGALGTLTEAEQVAIGLPWIEVLVQADPDGIALGSWWLRDWLRKLQSHVRTREELSCWQRVVDMLVVAGDTRIADLSD